MTEGQRDYMADLANRKGVVLDNTDNVSQAWASKKIEELKAMPDIDFPSIDDVQRQQVDLGITNAIKEMKLWNFQA